jgi:hypothetical protein
MAQSQRVVLDASGRAEVAFTVTNTSARMLPARLSARPQDQAKPEWLSLIGSSVRELAPSGSEQVIVQVAVPHGSPAGSYSFRLWAVPDNDPDDDYTEGPPVAFDVPGRKP